MTYYRSMENANPSQQGKAAMSLVVILIFVALSIFYLIQTNSLVAKNFELRAAQKLLKDKQAQNQKTSVSLTQARSLVTLENAAKNLNLIDVDKINYLKISPGFFALSD